MAQQIINVGNVANDGQGDPLRTAFQKTNDNFTELYDLGGLTGIQNGTSNIQIIEDGAITMAVGGVANTFVVTTVGATTLGTSSANAVSAVGDITAGGFFYGNGRQLTGVLAVTDANSLVGNTLNSNVVNSSLTSVGILTSMYSTGNVTGGNIIALANVQAGNIKTTGIISATGNITGGYFLGNGSQLSGIANINMGTSNVTVDISTGNIIVGVNGTPNVAVFYNNGISATGNITGNYFLGNGSQLAGISNINMGTSNVTVDPSTGNIIVGVNGTPNVAVFYNNGVSTTGNITAPYFLGNGSQLTGVTGVDTLTSLSVTGNTVTGNLTTGGLVSAAGNITGSNLITGGLVTAAGNITGSNLITGGLVTAAGNITGANINGSTVRSTLGFFSDSIQVGNILLNNFLVTTGNIGAGNVNAVNLVGNLIIASQPNVTSVGTLTSLSVSGAVTASSIVGTNISSTGNLTISTTGNVVLSNEYINGLNDPVLDQDAATKHYVDNIASTGITYHDAVLAATVGTLDSATGGTVSYAEPNGAGNGIGAKLTTTGTYNIIDTANIQTIGARVLVKNEANAAWNGVYTYANTTAIVRSVDADEYGSSAAEQLSINDYFFVSSGNVNLGSAWIVSAPVGIITFGTSNILFSQFSSSQAYTANTSAGISLIGQTFNTKVDNTTTAFDGGGNIVVKTSAVLTTPNIGAAIGTSLSTTGNITGANINGSGIGLTNVTAVAVGTLTSLSVTGNTQGGNLRTVGQVSAAGNVSGNNINSTNSIFSTVDVRAGGIISSAGNILTGTGISAVGNIDTSANISGSYFSGNGSQLTGIVATTIGTLSSLSVTGNTVTGNLQSLGTITSASLSVSTGNIGVGNINNNNANGVGNIGSSTIYFNTVFAKATSAQYADLAEKYTSDAVYVPGTVLSFGGSAEVTQSTVDADRRIIGIVSTRPSYIMNAGIESEYTVDVALQGRVPCLVQGTVARGDMMVSAGNGRARAEHNPTFGTVIGKALEDFAGEFGTIEVVVGRL